MSTRRANLGNLLFTKEAVGLKGKEKYGSSGWVADALSYVLLYGGARSLYSVEDDIDGHEAGAVLR